jgi:hypothetical protein
MKMISNVIIGGKAVITTEESKFVFWKTQTKYVAQREITKGYYTWLELPNLTLVPSRLSFQLDAWNRMALWPE